MRYYFFLVLLLNSLRIVCMQDNGTPIHRDIIPHITKHLDLFSTASLLRTCNNYYDWQSEITPNARVKTTIDAFLYSNRQQCYLLNSTDYNNALMHYAQNKNRVMMAHLIDNENDCNKEIRDSVVTFFLWDQKIYQPVSCTISAYRGIKKYIPRGPRFFPRKDLKVAIKDKNFWAVKILLKSGVNVNEVKAYKLYGTSLEIMELLIGYGLDINIFDGNGRTILHCAALINNVEMIEFLIEHEIDINKCNEWLKTPLWDACVRGHKEAVEFLIKKGADVNFKEIGGLSLSSHPLNAEIKLLLRNAAKDAQ